MNSDNQQKIQGIVDEILKLDLKQTSSLLEILCKELKIDSSDLAVSGSSAKNKVEEQDESLKRYTVSIVEFDQKHKIALIKELKRILGISLLEAKDKLSSMPIEMSKGRTKEECEQLMLELKDLDVKIERTEE